MSCKQVGDYDVEEWGRVGMSWQKEKYLKMFGGERRKKEKHHT